MDLHSHMDHSKMDHSQMNHGDMGHSGMDHGGGGMDHDMCSMSMTFNWNVKNTCIIFEWWHVRSTLQFILTLWAIVVIVAGYEALRAASRRYEESVAKKSITLPRRDAAEVSRKAHIVKAALYAFQSFYAFMIMLLFMTYNGWVMGAVAVGNFLGFMMFGGQTSATKDNACH